MKSILEEVKEKIIYTKQTQKTFSTSKLMWEAEKNRYKYLMGITPNEYHKIKDKEKKRIYDIRAKALYHLYSSDIDHNADNLRILITHHLNCAHLAKRFRKHVLEKW